MGHQQILLLILTAVILAVSFVASNAYFTNELKKANRQAIIQDMYNLASLAIAYYNTPASMGGGNGSWDVERFYVYSGYPLSNNGKRLITGNGEIKIISNKNGRLIVTGYGKEIGLDEVNSIRARIRLSNPREEGVFALLN